METTFYDDSQFRAMRNDYKSTKRPVTLDLESPGAFSKKQRFTTLLTSPDLHMLKLASPELERFIITQTGSITTTPTPTQFLFPKNVTEEQEQYARGFVDALAQLHQTGVDITGFTTPQMSDGTNVVNTSASQSALSRFYPGIIPFMQVANNTSSASSSATVPSSTKPIVNTSLSVVRPPSVESTSSNSYQGVSYLPLPHNITIKEEPQIVPSDSSGMSPPMSPINMENQEKIKLERKRHRNRIAASKCRRRKLERISRLEDKVRELKNENTELGTVASKLREQVCSLKQQVLNHAKSGCQIMVAHTF